MQPYENFRKANKIYYISGQVPLKENGQEDKGDDFYKLALESLNEIQKIANQLGTDMDHVVKTTLFMTDISKLALANKAYLKLFKNRKPARSAIGVKGLAGGSNLEIEAVICLD